MIYQRRSRVWQRESLFWCLWKNNVSVKEKPSQHLSRYWKRFVQNETDVWEMRHFNTTADVVEHRLTLVSSSTTGNRQWSLRFHCCASFVPATAFQLIAAVHRITTGISELFNHWGKWLSHTGGALEVQLPKTIHFLNGKYWLNWG